MRLFTLFLLSCCLLCACHTTRPAAAAAAVPEAGTNASTPVILTLLLKAIWNPDSSVHFGIFNDIRNQGRLKPGQGNVQPADFIVFFCDGAGKHLDSCTISHPLADRVEAVNGQGKLQTDIYKKEEGYTDVRINYQPAMKQIQIKYLEQQPAASRPQPLQTINLK